MSGLFKKVFIVISLSIAALLSLVIASVYIYRDKIIYAAINEINRYLITNIEIDPQIEVSMWKSFPEISLEFKNVKVHENLPGRKDNLLAEASKLYISFDTWNLLNNKYTINQLIFEEGYLHIRIESSGARNYDILKSDTAKATKPIDFSLDKIILKNVNFTYENSITKQKHDLNLIATKAQLKFISEVYQINLQSGIYVNKISIDNNTYFKKQSINVTSQILYNSINNTLKISSSNLQVENTVFKVKGDFSFNNTKKINLEINSDQASIVTLLSILPEKVTHDLSSYHSSGSLYCSIKIKGLISNIINPHIGIHFGANNALLKHPDLPYTIQDINFKGYFTNGKNNNSKSSSLDIQNISFKMDNKVLNGKMEINNFNDPFAAGTLVGEIDTKIFNSFFKISDIQQVSGTLNFDVNFTGKISDLKSKSTANRMKTEGQIIFKDIFLKLRPHPHKIKKLNGLLIFDNSDLVIKDLKAEVGNSDVLLNASLINVVSRVFYPLQPFYINAEVTSKFLDVDQLMEKESQLDTMNDPFQRTEISKKDKNNYYLVLKANVNKLKYQQHNIIDAVGSVMLEPDGFSIRNSNFKMAGGKIQTDVVATYTNNDNTIYQTSIKTNGTYIDSLLYEFKNFNQDFITHYNLKGEVSSTINAYFIIDGKDNVVMNSIKADIDAVIGKGELSNFKPMQSLSKFIDEKKLERIVFSELSNKIFIENSMITIPEMEIKSSISNIKISGTHSFTNSMDYRLTLPLKNFKRDQEDRDKAFGAIEEDVSGTSNIFLTIKGTADNFKVAYDVQKTRRKIKEDLKKEGEELRKIFKSKSFKKETSPQKEQEEFFDFN